MVDILMCGKASGMMESANARCRHDVRSQVDSNLLPIRQVAVKVLRSNIDDTEAEEKMVNVRSLLSHIRSNHFDNPSLLAAPEGIKHLEESGSP